MALQINNSEVEEVLYNGEQVLEVKINGVLAWELDKGGADLSGVPDRIESETIDFNQPSYALYQIKADGTHFAIANGKSSVLISPEWLPSEDDSSDYEVKFTNIEQIGPAALSGANGDWQSLTINDHLVSLSASGKDTTSTARIGITVRRKDLYVSTYVETTLQTLWRS